MAKEPIKILVINPNSSHAMTKAMEGAISEVGLDDSVEVATYTAPAGSPASINDDDDIRNSTEIVLKDLESRDFLKGYDGVLVACYSVHTLVDKLSRTTDYGRFAVTGIFEASILSALSLLPQTSSGPPESQWGVVTTGKFWEKHLDDGVQAFLGQDVAAPKSEYSKFRGVISTGLTAGDFHHVRPEEVEAKLVEATTTLLGDGGVSCIVMGCGGMAGLEEIIRATSVDQYGQDRGGSVYVVDGVKAGILQLEQTIRSRRLFQKPAT